MINVQIFKLYNIQCSKFLFKVQSSLLSIMFSVQFIMLNVQSTMLNKEICNGISGFTSLYPVFMCPISCSGCHVCMMHLHQSVDSGTLHSHVRF